MNPFNQCYLREIKEADLDLVLQWRNQEHIREVMFDNSIISDDTHRRWYEKNKQSEQTISKIFCLEDRPLGIINVTNLDMKNGKCDWGFYIGDITAPKGTGTIMGYLALNYIFADLNVRKLCAQILHFNQRSILFHERLGFQMEGILTKHIKRQEQFADVIIMALFKNDWNEKNKFIREIIEGMSL